MTPESKIVEKAKKIRDLYEEYGYVTTAQTQLKTIEDMMKTAGNCRVSIRIAGHEFIFERADYIPWDTIRYRLADECVDIENLMEELMKEGGRK